MANNPSRMSVASRADFLEFLEQLARVSSSSDFYNPNRDKKASRGKNRFKKTERCYLLELPPELRNTIYQTIYPMYHEESPISPLDIRNPDPDFLLTCGQIYREAFGYYEQARGHLWMDSNFLIKKECIKATELNMLDTIDLNLITCVTVLNDECEGKRMVARLVDFRGGWKIEYVDTNNPSQTTRIDYVCIHQRRAGVWRGMTWVEFHATREKLDVSLSRIGNHAGMKDQIMQILLVGPEEVKRIAVRTFWRSVQGVPDPNRP